MKKIIYPVILLTLLSLASCKSKKNMVSTLPSPVLNTDSVHADTVATVPADVFAPDHAGLKSWMSRKKRKVNRQRNKPLPEPNLLIVYFVKPKSLHQPKVCHPLMQVSTVS